MEGGKKGGGNDRWAAVSDRGQLWHKKKVCVF